MSKNNNQCIDVGDLYGGGGAFIDVGDPNGCGDGDYCLGNTGGTGWYGGTGDGGVIDNGSGFGTGLSEGYGFSAGDGGGTYDHSGLGEPLLIPVEYLFIPWTPEKILQAYTYLNATTQEEKDSIIGLLELSKQSKERV